MNLEDLVKPEAILFDFFGTLVEIDEDRPAMWELMRDMGYDSNIEIERIFNSLGFDGMKFPEDEKDKEYDDFRVHMFTKFCEFHGVKSTEVMGVVQKLMLNDRSWTVKAKEYAHSLIWFCNEKRIPIAICSNWDYPIDKYLKQAELPATLPALLSRDIYSRKPSKEFFSCAHTLVGKHIPLEAIWFVGDSWSADIVGAIRYGLTPVMVGEGENHGRGYVVGPIGLKDIFSYLVSIF